MQGDNNFYPSLSFWEKRNFFRHQDVIVIGSGFVGLNAAIYIKEHAPKLEVSIVDAGLLPLGASTRNAGFACFGTASELEEDLLHMEEKEVFETVAMRYKGLKRLREKWGDQAMDYLETGGVEVFNKAEPKVFERLASKLNYFNQKLEPIVEKADCIQIRANDYGLNMHAKVFFNSLEGQLDPGKLVKFLLAKARELGIEIYFNTKVESINESSDQVSLITKQGFRFTSKKCLIATNGFIRSLYPELPVQPARNQVLITKPFASKPIDSCFHFNKGYYYFRNVGNRILLGGARNISMEAESTDSFGQTAVIQQELIRFLEEQIIPNQRYEIDQWWSGIMGVGPSKKVIMEQIGEHQFVAVRLGGMGVAIGTHIGENAGQKILESL
jgi:glycine/D-amino acid oxidase-like deaminating enzyme